MLLSILRLHSFKLITSPLYFAKYSSSSILLPANTPWPKKLEELMSMYPPTHRPNKFLYFYGPERHEKAEQWDNEMRQWGLLIQENEFGHRRSLDSDPNWNKFRAYFGWMLFALFNKFLPISSLIRCNLSFAESFSKLVDTWNMNQKSLVHMILKIALFGTPTSNLGFRQM